MCDTAVIYLAENDLEVSTDSGTLLSTADLSIERSAERGTPKDSSKKPFRYVRAFFMDVSDNIYNASRDEMLKTMKENFAGLSKFLQNFRHRDYLRSSFIKECEEKLSKTGLKMISSTSNNGVSNVIFRKSLLSNIAADQNYELFRNQQASDLG